MGGIESVPTAGTTPSTPVSSGLSPTSHQTPRTPRSAPASFSPTTISNTTLLSEFLLNLQTNRLPTDPESPFYTPLFHSFSTPTTPATNSHHHQPHYHQISTIAKRAIQSPSDLHAAALTTALRAAVHRIRDNNPTPISNDSSYSPQPPPLTLIGALRFATVCLSSLQFASSADPDIICLTLAAGEAESALHTADRIDLGRSLIARTIVAALDVLTVKPKPDSSVAAAAIELILTSILDKPTNNDIHSSMPLAALVDRYPRPAAAVRALLRIVTDAVPVVTLPELLLIRTDPAFPVEATRGEGQTSANGVSASVNLFAASASALGAGMTAGLNDAWSALSSKMTIRAFTADANVESAEPEFNSEIVRENHVSLRRGNQQEEGNHQQEIQRSREGHQSWNERRTSDHTSERTHMNDPVNTLQGWLTGLQIPTLPLNMGMRENRASTPISTMSSDSNTKSPIIGNNDSIQIAEIALSLLCLLITPRADNPFREAMCLLQDTGGRATDAEMESETGVSFSRLYETLGHWVAHPQGSLLCYLLLTGNKRLRTFALARTDPDVLLIPLLASLRRRCTVGCPSSDAYFPAAVLLVLTADKGFCEAIDEIGVPPAWLTYIEDRKRFGNEFLSLSALVLLVCARVVQQSVVARRKLEDFFLGSIALGVMGNVAEDATRMHPLAAERLLALVEFLVRRRRKVSATIVSKDISKKEENAKMVLKNLTEMQGTTMEVIIAALRARSSVGVNRHLVYALLHAEGTVETAGARTAGPKCQAVGHVLRRVVLFFGRAVDEVMSKDKKGDKENSSSGGMGISVERVFAAIDGYARMLPRDVFHGLPDVRFRWEEESGNGMFTEMYCWELCREDINSLRLKLLRSMKYRAEDLKDNQHHNIIEEAEIVQ